MISFDDALATILGATNPLKAEERPVAECLGFGLSQPFHALVANPIFDNSEVDGFGVQEGASGLLRIVGESVAGGAQSAPIESGQAVRILTGAAIPAGVGAVVMQEDVRVDGNSIHVSVPPATGDHIRRRGSDYRAGEFLLETGTQVSPAVVSLFAANGLLSATTPRVPRVAIISNGDELISSGGNLGPNQIYESNGPGIATAVRQIGARVSYQALVKDEPEMQEVSFAKALEDSDVLIVSGGMSVGDRDHARSVLTKIGMQEVFWRISMRPGKPVLFGTVGEKLIFGLPGNPVSSLVTFHLLVRPALLQLMGVKASEPKLMARLAKPAIKAAGRTDFQRGHLLASATGSIVEPLDGQDSYRTGGLAIANCLIRLPSEATEIQEGHFVQVILLP